MKLTFLEASDGTRLSKTITATETRSYPNVKVVSSYEVTVPEGDIKAFEAALRSCGADGMCLLKGPLRGPLFDESRKGRSDNVAYAPYIVIDLDNAILPDVTLPTPINAADVARVAELAIALLPVEFRDVSYIAQASSSLGFKGNKVSMHLYFMLKTPLPPKSIKLWLRHLNLAIPAFADQLQLSTSGSTLRYIIDPSVADNSKLIFIAPPLFTDKTRDPFASADDRIVCVERANGSVELTPLIASIHPEILSRQIQDKKDELRVSVGLPKKKSKVTLVTHGDAQLEVLTNPDRMSINVVDDSNYPYVRCNINGGDSNAYWFNVDDPTYMLNFKDEPAFEIEKADPEFYATLFERYADRGAKDMLPTRPIVARDFYSDTYWNGVFDPNTGQFTEKFPLTATSRGSIEGFMKSHGRAAPSFIPDAKIVFDPSKLDDQIQMDTPPYYVNMYTRSPYMLHAAQPTVPLGYGTGLNMQHKCPTIYKIIYHMLGSSPFEVEHFINWLAFIYQNKIKSMTAWVLTGIPGTGKGLFVNKILKPLFGEQHVPMRAMENLEEHFNSYMRSAMFLVVDEFRMNDARLGATRLADKLKNMITEPNLTIRGMRSNQVELPSYTNFIFLTNRQDAIRLDEGDRRYNIGPRQEKKLVDAYPTILDELDNIEGELFLFAGILETFAVDAKMARTCMNNNAKTSMRAITMSIHEEFIDAYKRGDFAYFAEVLDISMTNTFEAGAIAGAQRIVRDWLMDAYTRGWSLCSADQLRVVYLAYAQPQPAPSPKEFSKSCHRAGLLTQRKRMPGAYSVGVKEAVRGFYVDWTTEKGELQSFAQDYIEPRDLIKVEAM